jgi:hypothetical protein
VNKLREHGKIVIGMGYADSIHKFLQSACDHYIVLPSPPSDSSASLPAQPPASKPASGNYSSASDSLMATPRVRPTIEIPTLPNPAAPPPVALPDPVPAAPSPAEHESEHQSSPLPDPETQRIVRVLKRNGGSLPNLRLSACLMAQGFDQNTIQSSLHRAVRSGFVLCSQADPTDMCGVLSVA